MKNPSHKFMVGAVFPLEDVTGLDRMAAGHGGSSRSAAIRYIVHKYLVENGLIEEPNSRGGAAGDVVASHPIRLGEDSSGETPAVPGGFFLPPGETVGPAPAPHCGRRASLKDVS
jgi:hypothetical protein